MKIAVLKEENDNRVSLVPKEAKNLVNKGIEVLVEDGCGLNAGISNEEYVLAGAKVLSRQEVIDSLPEVILSINEFKEIDSLKENTWIIGVYNYFDKDFVERLVRRGINSISLNLIPRISRAQSMDVLSSMATVAGYKAVLLAANYSFKMFPLLMTSGGTIEPSKVLVIGAGVAGLQAIATAKRLGALVWGFDPRSVTKEQIISVGGNPIDFSLEIIEDKSGYAKEVEEDILAKEREILEPYILESDVVISTASIPGKRAPILITQSMLDKLKKNLVIVDLASNSGGNCDLAKRDEVIFYKRATIVGYTNLPSLVPLDSSRLYSRNVFNVIIHFLKDGVIKPNFEDQIDQNVVLTLGKELVSNFLRN